MKKKIIIEGMSCGHCTAHVKEALEALEGVDSVNVSLEENCATVETDVEDSILKKAVEEEDFDVISIEVI